MTYYAQPPQTSQPHRGCLMGALAAVVAAAVILAALIGYGAWYFHKGFDNDPRIKVIVLAAAQNAEGALLIGKKIKVQELEHYAYGYSTGEGGSATYVLKVAGERGAGTLRADLDITNKAPVVKTLLFTDEEGHKHYLIGDGPPNPLLQQNSI